MTVAELIAELQKLNPDANVRLSAGDGEGCGDTIEAILDYTSEVVLTDCP